MFDLHSHLLPGIDDGAPDLETSLAMARAYADQGVECVACTPHILPGLYNNTGPQIRQAIDALQMRLDDAGIPLRLTSGADNHIVPTFVEGLKSGHLLTLGGSNYVLVEPPHHVAPARLEDLFFDILLGGYFPILTHPERLSWIENKYDVMERLAKRGVWMQITSGSLSGAFGKRPRYWAERMLDEGLVHIIATDAHNMRRRRPDLLEGRMRAEKLAGAAEAGHLVLTRPQGVLLNKLPNSMPLPHVKLANENLRAAEASNPKRPGGIVQRLRRLFS
ncbi:MAG: tyrosine-protein phosphatase [Rhodomicrobium sp.]